MWRLEWDKLTYLVAYTFVRVSALDVTSDPTSDFESEILLDRSVM